MGDDLRRELAALLTESVNPATRDLDRLDSLGILRRLNEQDATVPGVVAAAMPEIARAAEMVAESFRNGRRLIYMGAGTSGRLGVLDASECPPTFGVAPEQVVGLIAGGSPALQRSQEGAEDLADRGAEDLAALHPEPGDTVIGISASHRTPWTLGGVEEAMRCGCGSVFITCNPDVEVPGEIVIRLLTGAEAVAGSTRLKAGTAQKLTLNMITTTAMVLTGKVYENLMVDLDPLSEKLVERSRGLVMSICGVDYEASAELLERSDGHVKCALLMHLAGLEREEALGRLDAAGGVLRQALEQTDRPA